MLNALKKIKKDFILNESDGGSNINVNNDESSNSETEVINKLDRSVKFDEVDTVTFGLETDDGKIIKVYVNAEQAEDFEKALAIKLGEVDDIEEVLNELSKEYEIVDVEWPDDDGNSDKNQDEDDGSESLDQKVYGPKKGGDMEDQEDKQFPSESLNYGEELTLTLLEDSTTIESRFTTATQLMVYHAILDLGIPEIALARNPYRAAIIKGIKDTANQVQQNASMKIALKTFIRRAVDFEKEAAEHNEANKANVVKEAVNDYVPMKGDIVRHGVLKGIITNVDLPEHDNIEITLDNGKKIKAEADKVRLVKAGIKDNKKIKMNEDKINWSFSSDKENLTISCKELSATINSEETEKLIKGINNHEVTVCRDETDEHVKKFVFSPRGSGLLMKQIGSTDGHLMTARDIEELIKIAVPERKSKE